MSLRIPCKSETFEPSLIAVISLLESDSKEICLKSNEIAASIAASNVNPSATKGDLTFAKVWDPEQRCSFPMPTNSHATPAWCPSLLHAASDLQIISFLGPFQSDL
ncbi:unnamed protein product [Brassica napus]|uniref:(rape) hypothetical protein n=1 Tax=Brassica napus TaxID=3708 RepID=A0A816N9Q1_BRANA|nr:unnamed protein product [Brassica napus]